MSSDEWQTPQWLFNELNTEFHFDIDLCATGENTKCSYYCGNYLNYTSLELQDLASKENITCFMNPPYSNPKPFIEKAWEDSRYAKIVCLVKCDPSTKWWAVFYEYDNYREFKDGRVSINDRNRGPKPGCEVRFFPKRVQFDPPNNSYKECRSCYGAGKNSTGWSGKWVPCKSCKGTGKKPLPGPTFSSALIIMDRRGI